MDISNTPQLSGSGWWRATEYEVVGGTHVVPAEDAEIEIYDPFDAHEDYWGGRTRGEPPPPYVELRNLDCTDPWAIADWCTRHGLLGILPHRTLEAFFWPRWETTSIPTGGSSVGSISTGAAMEGVMPVQEQYRQGTGSRRVEFKFQSRTWETDERPLTEDEMQEVRQGTWETGFQGRLEQPGVRKLNAWAGDAAADDLVAGYARFFPRTVGVVDWEARQPWGGFPTDAKPRSLLGPDAEEEIAGRLRRREYPTPYSSEFLREYGEPVHLFRQYAQYLGSTISVWSEAQNADSLDALLDELSVHEDREELLLPSQVAGLQPAHPYARLVPDEDTDRGFRWARRWSLPSLYSALHVMVLEDFTLEDTEGRYCEKCGKLFATRKPKKRYCSSKCRKAAEQARRRARRREEGRRPS